MIFIHTEWSDILTFTYDYDACVLQGRKNKFTKATSFRVAIAENGIGRHNPKVLNKDDLKAANLWHTIKKESEGKYGRTIGYVRNSDNIYINDAMIENGVAWKYKDEKNFNKLKFG